MTWPQCRRHVLGAAVVARVETVPDRAEIGGVALAVPGRRDGLVDQRRLDVVDPAPAPAHASDDARQHGETLLAVVAVVTGGLRVDHGERVERRGVLAGRR